MSRKPLLRFGSIELLGVFSKGDRPFLPNVRSPLFSPKRDRPFIPKVRSPLSSHPKIIPQFLKFSNAKTVNPGKEGNRASFVKKNEAPSQIAVAI
ncbi:hypothetical protein NDA07_16535 [Microcoleus vaginatus DQ-U2]|uniref:hypothetical protein n=1 Tax=Microcoleus vaginatus TaxID=119532 RepID=UPI001689E905|nr:hypothetical protein [Microcoleus sp. FACHB-DQ6]